MHLPSLACAARGFIPPILSLLLLMLPTIAVGEEVLPDGWISFDGVTATPTAPSVRIISSSTSRIQLVVSVPGMLCETVEHDTTEYKQLSLPTYFHTLEVGAAALPAVRQMLAVPRGCQVSISAVALDTLTFSSCMAYPVEAEVTRYTDEGWSYIDHEFCLDQQAYGRSGAYPSSMAAAVTPGSFRGQGVVEVACYPLSFDPTLLEIKAYPEMLVTVEMIGGSGGMSEELGPFTSIAQALLLGYSGIGGGERGSAGPGRWGVRPTLGACADSMTDYLMIVENSLMSSSLIDTLAKHRAVFNGYNVAIVPDTVVAKHHVPPGISDDAIHDFIQDLYEYNGGTAEHMQDGRLGYVLLVGDARDAEHGGADSLLPAHEYNDATTTDHWYACVDGDAGDAYPDLMIGRLCASDTTELRREVYKFVTYERTASSTGQPWRNKMLLSEGFCDSVNPDWIVSTHAAFDTIQAMLPVEWSPAEEVHADDQGGDDCDWQQGVVRGIHVDRVNGGIHAVEVCAHGHTHECETFRDDNVGELSNDDGAWPLWISYSCLTGAYDLYNPDVAPPDPPNYDCLGEALMHEQDAQSGRPTGALCFFGASEESPAVWTTLGLYLWEGLFGGRQRVGDFIAFAKMKLICTGGSVHVPMMYNLLGDPALDVLVVDTGWQGYSTAPDYVVWAEDVVLSAAFPSVGESVTITAEIRNESNYIPDSPVDVVFEAWDSEWAVWDTLGWDTVQPGDWSSDTASVQWVPSDSDVGRTELRVRVDPSDAQEEISELNNEAQCPLCGYFERGGFPANMWGADGVAPSFVDINSDGSVDVVCGTRVPGRIATFSSSSAESLWVYPLPSEGVLLGPVAIADLNADGEKEIAFTRAGCVDVLGLSGSTPGAWWSLRAPSGELLGSASLADIDQDGGEGYVELVVEYEDTSPYVHGVRVVDHDGGGTVWDVSYTATIQDLLSSLSERAPVVADITGDGRPEVISSYLPMQEAPTDCAVSIHAADNGAVLWTAELPGVQFCSPAVADAVPDSTGVEVLFAADELSCLSSRGHECWSEDIVGAPAGIAVCDMDDDGSPEIAVTTYDGLESPQSTSGVLYVFDAAGSIIASVATNRAFTTQPVVGDLDGDDAVEILVVSCKKETFGNEVWMTSHLEIFTLKESPPSLEPTMTDAWRSG